MLWLLADDAGGERLGEQEPSFWYMTMTRIDQVTGVAIAGYGRVTGKQCLSRRIMMRGQDGGKEKTETQQSRFRFRWGVGLSSQMTSLDWSCPAANWC